ncbi:CGNR zinc finger domain-containing protein [Phytohabitans sp. LJ34]|uniref:CGNR zinc finger domain-containing protein n=1 Tax=Phytohabitans sp. LJ34 TaxID=3452217 RepID=UPI003F8C45D4
MTEALDQVRDFLNTWEVPNDTRVPVDHLEALVSTPERWARAFPDLPRAARADLADLRALRADLRAVLGHTHPVGLGDRLARHDLVVTLREPPHEPAVLIRPARPSAAGDLLAAAVNAVAAGRWHRLKACPDCQWVFYDTSRNASRTWCAMTPGGPAGRGCGGIAKTRAYRARSRTR